MADSQSPLNKLAEQVRDRYKREQEKVDIQNTKKAVEKAHSEYLMNSLHGFSHSTSSGRQKLADKKSTYTQKESKCPIIGCGISFTNNEKYRLHISQSEASVHTSCNPLKHLPNARLVPNTTGHVCPVCGKLYMNFDACREHMSATEHILLQEPLELAGYICPQCLEVYPDQSSCGEHMADKEHRYVQYPFENDLDPDKKVVPIPLPKNTLMLYLGKCASVECHFINKTTVQAESNHGETFALLLKSTTCIQCLRLFDDMPHDNIIHQCSDNIQGILIENNCKTFEEFVRRLALKPISLKKSNEDSQNDGVIIIDEADETGLINPTDGASCSISNGQNTTNSTENNGERKNTSSGENKQTNECTKSNVENKKPRFVTSGDTVGTTTNCSTSTGKNECQTMLNTTVSQVQNSRYKELDGYISYINIGLDSRIVKTSRYIMNYKLSSHYGTVRTPLDIFKHSSASGINLNSLKSAVTVGNKRKLTTSSVKKAENVSRKRKNESAKKNVSSSVHTGNTVPRRLNFNDNQETASSNKMLKAEPDSTMVHRNMKRRKLIKLVNEESRLNRKGESNNDQNNNMKPVSDHYKQIHVSKPSDAAPTKPFTYSVSKNLNNDQNNNMKPVSDHYKQIHVSSKPSCAAPAKPFTYSVSKNFNFSQGISPVFSATNEARIQNRTDKCSKQSSKLTWYSDSTRQYQSTFVPNNHDKVFSSKLKTVIGTMSTTCTNLKELHLDGNPLLRNRIPDNLHLMNQVIFLDVDNWPAFFQKLPKCLPEKTFVWGFYGGTMVWKEPVNCQAYNATKRDNCFHIHNKCGNRKDAADFAICMWVGRMDERLPKHIPFTILSGDKGFCEIEDQMASTERRTVVINPHHETPEGVYSLVISVSQTSINHNQ